MEEKTVYQARVLSMKYPREQYAAYCEVIPQEDGTVIARVYSRKDGLAAEKAITGSPEKWIESEMKKWKIEEVA